MNLSEEYLSIADARSALYAFLARIYRVEIDRKTLEELKTLELSEEGNDDEYAQGCSLMDTYLHGLPFNACKELAVDYARVFLAAGIPDAHAAFPYESVYTSPDHLVMQDACDEVRRIYRKKHLGVNASVEPPDHIAFELEFMARLVGEGETAARNGDEFALAGSIQEQRSFLSSHLMNWAPEFVDDVMQYASTGFYKGAALMTRGFLAEDAQLLESFEVQDQAE